MLSNAVLDLSAQLILHLDQENRNLTQQNASLSHDLRQALSRRLCHDLATTLPTYLRVVQGRGGGSKLEKGKRVVLSAREWGFLHEGAPVKRNTPSCVSMQGRIPPSACVHIYQ